MVKVVHVAQATKKWAEVAAVLLLFPFVSAFLRLLLPRRRLTLPYDHCPKKENPLFQRRELMTRLSNNQGV